MANILFDLDGTLTDPADGITACIQHALRGLGRSVPSREELLSFIGPPLHVSFRDLLLDDALTDDAVALYRERFADVGLFENRLYAGIPSLLETLQQDGHTLYVATSKPHVYAERIIEHFDLSRFFSAVHGPEFDGTRSDKAELIAHIVACERLASSDTWMVGDRAFDIAGARANAIRSVGVLWGYGSHEELSDAGATELVDRPSRLPAIFVD